MHVSVCIITYNQEKFVRAAIEGVLAQEVTFPYELVIGDDGSRDSTPAICAEYQKTHPQIISCRAEKQNLGMRGNVIRSLSQCRGKYIAICEGDDYWTDPKKLQRQVDFLEANPALSFCCDRFRICDEAGKNFISHGDDLFIDGKDKSITIENLFSPYVAKLLTILFRRDALEGLDYSSAYFRDIHLFVHLLTKGNGHCFNHVGAVYRRTQQGVWALVDDFNKKRISLQVAQSLIVQYGNRYPSLINYHLGSLAGFLGCLRFGRQPGALLKALASELKLCVKLRSTKPVRMVLKRVILAC